MYSTIDYLTPDKKLADDTILPVAMLEDREMHCKCETGPESFTTFRMTGPGAFSMGEMVKPAGK